MVHHVVFVIPIVVHLFLEFLTLDPSLRFYITSIYLEKDRPEQRTFNAPVAERYGYYNVFLYL